MNPSTLRSSGLLYAAVLALSLGIIATSVVVVAQGSRRFMQPAAREKTALDLQIESAREIRAMLNQPIVVPPLPPITARPLHEARSAAHETSKSSQEQEIPAVARDAVAMAGPAAAAPYNALLDRHRPQ